MKIHHDLHTHTVTSSCCHDRTATAENYIKLAAEMGHEILGISNHLWDESVEGASSWYKDQPFTYVLGEKPLIDSLDHRGVKVLYGAEVEYTAPNDTLALRAENAKVLDYVLIPHTHTHMKGFVFPEIPEVLAFREQYKKDLAERFPWMSEKLCTRIANSIKMEDMGEALDYSREEYERKLAEFLVGSYEKLVANPEFAKIVNTLPTIIAHPFAPSEPAESCRRIYGYVDKDRLHNCFEVAVKMGFAYDVNLCTFKFPDDLDNDPMVDLMRHAKDAGVKFTFGTDAHSCVALQTMPVKGEMVCDAIGITEKNLFEKALG